MMGNYRSQCDAEDYMETGIWEDLGNLRVRGDMYRRRAFALLKQLRKLRPKLREASRYAEMYHRDREKRYAEMFHYTEQRDAARRRVVELEKILANLCVVVVEDED